MPSWCLQLNMTYGRMLLIGLLFTAVVGFLHVVCYRVCGLA